LTLAISTIGSGVPPVTVRSPPDGEVLVPAELQAPLTQQLPTVWMGQSGSTEQSANPANASDVIETTAVPMVLSVRRMKPVFCTAVRSTVETRSSGGPRSSSVAL